MLNNHRLNINWGIQLPTRRSTIDCQEYSSPTKTSVSLIIIVSIRQDFIMGCKKVLVIHKISREDNNQHERNIYFIQLSTYSTTEE